MVDRRTKILTASIKKSDAKRTQTAINEELATQGDNRDKIINRISS